MSLPVAANTTLDIYRAGNNPPASPDVSGVSGFLTAKGASTLTSKSYTHLLRVDGSVDIRDDYTTATFDGGGPNADVIYVPDKNGTPFVVVLVRRVGRGTAADHKEVLLKRNPVTWPSNNV